MPEENTHLFWTKSGMYKAASYSSEADLEAAIVLVQKELFGPNRIYLDIKKKIGVKGGIRNIPDGYLIDLSGSTPRLYVVENELAPTILFVTSPSKFFSSLYLLNRNKSASRRYS